MSSDFWLFICLLLVAVHPYHVVFIMILIFVTNATLSPSSPSTSHSIFINFPLLYLDIYLHILFICHI